MLNRNGYFISLKCLFEVIPHLALCLVEWRNGNERFKVPALEAGTRLPILTLILTQETGLWAPVPKGISETEFG